MAQANSHPKIFWKTLNDALWRKSISTDVNQLTDDKSNSDLIHGSKNIALKINKFFVNNGNTYGKHFSHSSAFENYMSSAHVS